MKHIRLSAALAVLAFATAACNTDLTGLNVNPNNPSTATPPPAGALFTQASQSAVGRFSGTGMTLSGMALFANHIAQVQYLDEDRGHIRTTTIDGINAGAYPGELEDYEKVKGIGVRGNSAAVWGPAQVMQSWVFQNLTDMWGDIPYSEALQGDVGGSLAPKYDMQRDIYYDIVAKLADASTKMGAALPTETGLGNADMIYGGNLAKWQRLANTLRARMALRMLKVDAAKAGTELTAAITAGLFTSNADNAKIAWPGDGVFNNPWSNNFSTRDDHRVAKTLLDTMVTLADPRVAIYAQPTKWDPATNAPWLPTDTPRQIGLQNGMDNVTVTPFFNTTSRPGAIFYPGATAYGTFGTAAGRATPSYIATYSEAEFILAEAAERGLGGATGAATHYANAVTASIQQWGGTAGAAATYLARPGVAYAGGATGLRQIGLQRWISLFTQSEEAWSEWRRTGNPNTVAMGPKAYLDVLTIPRRWPYPSNELSVNATNLQAAITRQGPDTYSTRMWWDR